MKVIDSETIYLLGLWIKKCVIQDVSFKTKQQIKRGQVHSCYSVIQMLAIHVHLTTSTRKMGPDFAIIFFIFRIAFSLDLALCLSILCLIIIMLSVQEKTTMLVDAFLFQYKF